MMSDSQNGLIGRCFCGELFVAAKTEEYRSIVSRHIVDEHRDQPADKPLVELLEGTLNE
jgi:ferredoxin-thioredoxin reductase catalytic subunit